MAVTKYDLVKWLQSLPEDCGVAISGFLIVAENGKAFAVGHVPSTWDLKIGST